MRGTRTVLSVVVCNGEAPNVPGTVSMLSMVILDGFTVMILS